MITSVTTVTTMILDVNKWRIYRMYGNGWCHLVPVVTEGGIDLVVDCGALAVEIPSSTAGMRARHYARRCAGNHRCLIIGAENQSSTSTRWRVESKRAANAISSPCHVQRTANIRRTRPAIAGGGDYKYARNVVRLAIEAPATTLAKRLNSPKGLALVPRRPGVWVPTPRRQQPVYTSRLSLFFAAFSPKSTVSFRVIASVSHD